MTGSTPKQSFSYPTSADSNFIVTYLNSAADAVDDKLVAHFSSPTSRDAIITAPTAGMMAWCDSTSTLYTYNGSKWLGNEKLYMFYDGAAQEYYSSGTFSDSPTLWFAMEANSVYMYEFRFQMQGFSLGNFDAPFQVNAPTGTTGAWQCLTPISGTTDRTNCTMDCSHGAYNTGNTVSASSFSWCCIKGLAITSSTPGNLQLQFRATTSDFALLDKFMRTQKVG